MNNLDKKMNKINKILEKNAIYAIKLSGSECFKGSKKCKDFLIKTSNSCVGCKSLVGCDKLAYIKALVLKESTYEQTNKDINLILTGKGNEVDYELC